MARLLVAIFGLILSIQVHAQFSDKPKQPDIPGDIMIDFGFNVYRGNPEFLDLRFWPSRNVAIYYQYTHKLSDRFTVNPAIGIAAEKYAFDQNLNFIPDANRNFSFDTLRGINPTRNKLAVNYAELPVELRFFPKKTIDGEGFFVGIGAIVGYRIESHSKIKYERGSERRAEKFRGDFGLNDIRAGATLRVGWKAFHLYGKYYFTDPYRRGPFGANPSTFSFGVNFTGF